MHKKRDTQLNFDYDFHISILKLVYKHVTHIWKSKNLRLKPEVLRFYAKNSTTRHLPKFSICQITYQVKGNAPASQRPLAEGGSHQHVISKALLLAWPPVTDSSNQINTDTANRSSLKPTSSHAYLKLTECLRIISLLTGVLF